MHLLININEAERVYMLHYYNNKFNKVPSSWCYPRVGVFDLWRQWHIGDTIRNVPPLRKLKTSHLEHLDTLPLSEEEMHGRTGPNRNNRRPARKVLHDMKTLMGYMKFICISRGVYEEDITAASVDRMFIAIADIFNEKERDAQTSWITVLCGLRRRYRIKLSDFADG